MAVYVKEMKKPAARGGAAATKAKSEAKAEAKAKAETKDKAEAKAKAEAKDKVETKAKAETEAKATSAARGGADATKAKAEGDLESRKMRLRELDRSARVTNWLDSLMWAGDSCYGMVTNEQWCVREAARNVGKGRWMTVKHCGPLVALFRDSMRVDRREIQDADFMLISDEVRTAFEAVKRED